MCMYMEWGEQYEPLGKNDSVKFINLKRVVFHIN